jgi:hypothetical protein
MKRLKFVLLFLSLSLVFTGCFTIHQPQLASNTINYLPPADWPRVETSVTRDYILVFGGSKKQGMMNEALSKLSKDYAGYLPYTLENITIDERRTHVFFIYSSHKMQVAANLNFIYDGYLNESTKAIKDKQRFGFNIGDVVVFNLNNYQKPRVGIITRFGFADDAEIKTFGREGGETDKTEVVATNRNLPDISAATQAHFSAQPGDKLAFYPVGYSGEPLQGTLKEVLNNSSVYIILTQQSKEAWKALGGTLTPESGIYAPIHRVLPSNMSILVEN